MEHHPYCPLPPPTHLGCRLQTLDFDLAPEERSHLIRHRSTETTGPPADVAELVPVESGL